MTSRTRSSGIGNATYLTKQTAVRPKNRTSCDQKSAFLLKVPVVTVCDGVRTGTSRSKRPKS
jgi:hypothetical protein